VDGDGTTTVLVGVTGGIAAYKSCELVRALMKRGYRVKVVMTDAATRFVTPLTFRTLTNEPVAVSLWEDDPSAPVHHISLAEEAHVFVIAPCTANVIAKIAQGRADDLLTTAALATEAPIVVAPAMNVHMWRDEATQELLRARGVVFVEPDSGELACGDVGEGRLAPVEAIAEAVMAEAERAQDLAGRHILVTAGGTQEPIDPVRYIGNRSSGKTGFAIADEAARRGARVTLVTGPTHLADPFGVEVVRVQTALQMHAAVMGRAEDADAVVASAAVADFRPAEVASGKIKKADAPEAIALVRNPDILAELGAREERPVLVGFAAETSDVELNARHKLEAKRCDLVVANDVSDPALGFGTDANRVALVTRDDVEWLPVLSKRVIARAITDRLARLLGGADA
jgi:phosphopantothenoylcysteine decarboxylase/phosphopantothenate--cysteine ligase